MALSGHLPEEVRILLQEIRSDENDLKDEAFFFAMDHQARRIVWTSKNVSDILGYDISGDSSLSFTAFLRIIVKDDHEQFVRHQKKLKHNFPVWGPNSKLPVRVAQDVRVNTPYRNQMRILIQQQILKTNGSLPLWSVGSVMDITHIKNDPELSLAVFAPDGMQLTLERVVGWSKEKLFTEREMEVLQLLSKGYKSKDIEKILNISLHTVRTHRRNMLKKTRMDNTSQLINFALKEGIIK
jgi:DNA-binding CsgD family transcriptional regulator